MSFPELRNLSLRARLAVMLCIGLGLTMAVGFIGLHHVVRNQIFDAAWENLEERLDSLGDFAARNPGRESTADHMLEFRSQAHEDYFEIRDARGRLLARSASSAGRDLQQPSTDTGEHPNRYALTLPDGHDGIAIRGVIRLAPDDPRGHLLTVVATETAQIEALETRVHGAMLAIALSSLAAGVVAATFAIRHGLAPVDQLASSAESIDPDGPRRALDVGSLPRELVPLGQKLSALLHRLFDARDRERRFTRSVAHELRTPLAEVRMIADVGTLAPSPDGARHALREVSVATEELQQTVAALLALARYESGQETPQPDPVDLAAEVRSQLRKLEPAAKQRALVVNSRLPSERWVLADPALLRRLLANLLGNASSHASHGSAINVTLGAEGPLVISNPAPHLTSQDMARLGERFYRVGPGSGSGHVGLGLALANSIATVCRLRLHLQLDPDRLYSATVDGFRPVPEASA
jgi:two-component system sensor histidine kinase QseC